MRSRVTLLAVVAGLIVAACGGGESSGTTPSDATTRTTDHGDGSSFDVSTVEELIDAHDQAWLDNDPKGVGAFFTDEGVFVDLIGPTVGREEIVRYAEIHVELIPESQRTGPVEIQGDGTFVYRGYHSDSPTSPQLAHPPRPTR